MFKTKEQKGITLISLVITVIILLILAAVAINLAVDSNGLFKKTGDAANKWNTSVTEEKTTIQNLLDIADNVGKVNPISKYVTEESTGRTAPIPTGYVVSQIPGENTIAGGLVIYEGTEEVIGEKDSSAHTTAMTTRNQYVWIPVDDINDMVMCSICGGTIKKLVYDDTNKTLKCTNTHDEGITAILVGKLYYAGGGGRQDFTDTEQVYSDIGDRRAGGCNM